MTTEVTIAELKNHLSRYLRSVRQGHEIVVKNREQPVARLVPFDTAPRFQIIKATRSPKELRRIIRSMRPRKPRVSSPTIATRCLTSAPSTFTTLDGKDRRLPAGTLMICDGAREVAIAGIMGGAPTAVSDTTRDILLESAFFSPDAIAGKSRALGFGSDSSFRFERGVDFDGTTRALDRATQLVLEICGGQAGPISEAITVSSVAVTSALRLRSSARAISPKTCPGPNVATFSPPTLTTTLPSRMATASKWPSVQ